MSYILTLIDIESKTIYDDIIFTLAILTLIFLTLYLKVPQKILTYFKKNKLTSKVFLIPKHLLHYNFNNDDIIVAISSSINIIYDNNQRFNINLIKDTNSDKTLFENNNIYKEESMRKFNINVNGNSYYVEVEEILEKNSKQCSIENKQTECLTQEIENALSSPMSGTISDIKVSVGAEVVKGDTLIILDSMDIKNELRSPFDGTISSIDISINDSVSIGDTLITFEQSFVTLCE